MRLERFFALVVLCAVPALARAEAPATTGPTGTTVESTAGLAGSAVYGRLELRPTWGTASGIFNAQNNAEIGYRFTADTKILFNQSFNFDLRNPNSSGMNFTVPDARIEADFNNLWTDRRGGWAFDYQPRLHVPTDAGKRDVGLITEFRHQLQLTKTFSEPFQMTAALIPAFHAYSQAGGLAGGKLAANPIFENRLEVTAKWMFARNWKLEMPLKFWQTRYREFAANALHNDMWAFAVTMKPEIQWAIDPHVTLGVAFETGNFFSENLQKATFGDAFKNAQAQIALIATL